MARSRKTEVLDLTQAVSLTVERIERLTCRTDIKTQAFLRDSVAPGLAVRVTNTGYKAFVFEDKLHGKTFRHTIGSVHVWTIKLARAEARKLAVLIDSGQDPRELARARREAKAHAELEHQRAKAYTLGALAMDYAEQLERMGRTSHVKVRGMLRLHLLEGRTELAGRPACQVTGEEVTDLLRPLIEAGKSRTAMKLRAGLRSAYEMARTATMDSFLPPRFKAYGVKHNPAADTKAIRGDSAKAPLFARDLRLYWQAIKDVPTFEAAVLRLHLLAGGQRLEQLCRLRSIDARPGEIQLFDPKGRPGKKPRGHPIPLTPEAARALAQVVAWAPTRKTRSGKTRSGQPEGEAGTYVISTDGGRTCVTGNALSKWSKAAGAGAGIVDFTAKRIRSGVETALASMRVSKEDRGHLLSHGVSGVQANSYDGYDYMDVKLAALEALYRFLERHDADVITGALGRAA